MRADVLGTAAVARRVEPTVATLSVDGPLRTLEEIYREHAPRFRRVAYAIVRDRETAEDVVQEAFAKAIVRRGSFRGSGDDVAWVWRIVVNTALSRNRRRRLEALLVDRSRAAPETGADAITPDDRVRHHVARLPRRQRLALFLHYYADMDYETTGLVLSVAPGTVGKLLHDARATLRRTLEADADA
jgi:RNA polymerase sigma-70 factor, ECF subfamily